jgi:hypothetical protein
MRHDRSTPLIVYLCKLLLKAELQLGGFNPRIYRPDLAGTNLLKD